MPIGKNLGSFMDLPIMFITYNEKLLRSKSNIKFLWERQKDFQNLLRDAAGDTNEFKKFLFEIFFNTREKIFVIFNNLN